MFIKINYAGSDLYINTRNILSFSILGDDTVYITLVDGSKLSHQGGSHSFLSQLPR